MPLLSRRPSRRLATTLTTFRTALDRASPQAKAADCSRRCVLAWRDPHHFTSSPQRDRGRGHESLPSPACATWTTGLGCAEAGLASGQAR